MHFTNKIKLGIFINHKFNFSCTNLSQNDNIEKLPVIGILGYQNLSYQGTKNCKYYINNMYFIFL